MQAFDRQIKPEESEKQPDLISKKRDFQSVSKFLLPPELLQGEQHFVDTSVKMQFEKSIALPAFENGLVQQAAALKKKSRLEHARRSISIFIGRIIAWFSSRRKKSSLSARGKKALSQLEELYSLISIGSMGEVSLRVAYGEACYYLMQESKQHQKTHKGKGVEDYQAYFDRFLGSEANWFQ